MRFQINRCYNYQNFDYFYKTSIFREEMLMLYNTPKIWCMVHSLISGDDTFRTIYAGVCEKLYYSKISNYVTNMNSNQVLSMLSLSMSQKKNIPYLIRIFDYMNFETHYIDNGEPYLIYNDYADYEYFMIKPTTPYLNQLYIDYILKCPDFKKDKILSHIKDHICLNFVNYLTVDETNKSIELDNLKFVLTESLLTSDIISLISKDYKRMIGLKVGNSIAIVSTARGCHCLIVEKVGDYEYNLYSFRNDSSEYPVEYYDRILCNFMVCSRLHSIPIRNIYRYIIICKYY
jgi:hypothetical protein